MEIDGEEVEDDGNWGYRLMLVDFLNFLDKYDMIQPHITESVKPIQIVSLFEFEVIQEMIKLN